MAIQNTTSTTTSTTSADAASKTTTKAAGQLGKDDFLKLLVGQMQNQDPMNPSSQDFMAQMTQFTMLEQITNLAESTEKLNQATNVNQSLGLLGRTVTYLDDNDVAVTGKVEDVAVGGGAPKLTVAGKAGIDPSVVSSVR
jgi:flagellar basal-body rod modification protein FlgD